MLIPSEINYFAVLGAAALDIAIGAVWYSRFLFGKLWKKSTGRTDAEMEETRTHSGLAYVMSTFGAIIISFAIAVVFYHANISSLLDGVKGGVFLWVGFVAAIIIPFAVFERRGFGGIILYVAYKFVSFVAMGAIIAFWSPR